MALRWTETPLTMRDMVGEEEEEEEGGTIVERSFSEQESNSYWETP